MSDTEGTCPWCGYPAWCRTQPCGCLESGCDSNCFAMQGLIPCTEHKKTEKK